MIWRPWSMVNDPRSQAIKLGRASDQVSEAAPWLDQINASLPHRSSGLHCARRMIPLIPLVGNVGQAVSLVHLSKLIKLTGRRLTSNSAVASSFDRLCCRQNTDMGKPINQYWLQRGCSCDRDPTMQGWASALRKGEGRHQRKWCVGILCVIIVTLRD